MSTTSDFTVIPALDLMDGNAVHAKAGPRTEYRPVASPFGHPGDPAAIARGLLAAASSSVLYIADLDAITGIGSNFELVRGLGYALPNVAIWVDAGFSGVGDCAFWLPLGATLVIGSEGVKTAEDWLEIKEAFGESLVLSLDFGAEGPIGPSALFTDADLWPDRVIAMNLARVGGRQGPDLDVLAALIGRGGGRAVFAAGGVRNGADLAELAAAGASGALVATSLHSGALTQKEIAALIRERRSQA
jgi:phosphoribosylformimino-5-aminoimidazole carboxamide ribotide isomerase